MKIKIKYIILAVLICFICIWVGSIIKCEVLTYLHCDELKTVLNDKHGKLNSFKVIDYQPHDISQVYYVANDNTMGSLLRLKYDSDKETWYILDYIGGWSKTGNADDMIYPYLWHCIYFMF